MKKQRYIKATFYSLSIIFVIAIVTKIYQNTLLPMKYFYDSLNILSLMNGNYNADKTYVVTAKIFDAINIFGFSSLIQYSITFGIIFNIVIFVELLKRNKTYTTSQYIFIYVSTVLLNIYVFNLSKDIIQFTVFLLVYHGLIKDEKSNKEKLFFIVIVLIIEALTYRMYYGIMAIMIMAIYIAYNMLLKNKKINKKIIFKTIMLCLLVFFTIVFIVSIISKENYEQILNVRDVTNSARNESVDAVTIINDLLGKNTNFLIFICNYIINFIRMALPFELLLKGIKYIPFVIYQIYVVYILLRLIKKISSDNILLIATYLAFFMISVIFEPDFGSFVRHESAISLILIEICKKGEKTNERED